LGRKILSYIINSNKLEKQRTTGQKIVDGLMTPDWSTRKFSEIEPSKKKQAVAIVAAVLGVYAAGFGISAAGGPATVARAALMRLLKLRTLLGKLRNLYQDCEHH